MSKPLLHPATCTLHPCIQESSPMRSPSQTTAPKQCMQDGRWQVPGALKITRWRAPKSSCSVPEREHTNLVKILSTIPSVGFRAKSWIHSSRKIAKDPESISTPPELIQRPQTQSRHNFYPPVIVIYHHYDCQTR